jgi:two-component system response regulator FixJ
MATPPGETVATPATILCVVEGDENERDSLTSVLERLHLPVRSYASGEELLEALGQSKGRTSLDLLVASVRLPGMSGIELLKKIRARGVSAPTILVSDEGDIPMAVDAMRAGAVDFLEKPFVDRVLLRRAETALDSLKDH